MNKRIEYYDFLRGVAIIGVIGIHAFWSYQDYLKETGITMFDINIFIRQLIGCCVPMFLALSGFFLANKDVSSFAKYRQFLRKQVARVYIPCLIFSLPFLYWGICKSLGMNNSFIEVCTKRWLICRDGNIIDNILYYLVCAKGVFYFAAVIIQFYFLLPIMQWLANKKVVGLSIAFAISFVSTVVLYYIVYIAQINLSLIVYGGLFPFWTLYFVIGVFYGKGYRFGFSWKMLAVIALLLVPVLYTETYYMVIDLGYNLPAAMGNRKFSWIIYCVVCLLLMFEAVDTYKSNAFTRFINTAGEYSYGIYLIHLYFLLFVIKAVNPHIHWLVETVLSLLLSMAFIWVCRKVSLPFSKKYLGF
ncbi:acyltransferase [Dysgonomonas sp. ZJ709]|uniref:acyltransferase n=1 Tax=Dysgonomonas sp. ZJ709 TaxID=2709797 RepID=UPI0013EDF861|nr:acyltransferase [Dysgonomonas sp. ZJ709]